MRRRDPAILAAVAAFVALTTASCGSGLRNTKAGRVKSVEQVAPRYEVRDDASTRQRLAQQEKLGLALNRLQSGDYADAERQARAVLRKDAGSVDARTVLAAVLGARGDVAGAGEAYRAAAELAPQRGDVLNNYGAWLCANGRPADALGWFDRAMADPRYGQPASVLANAGGCALQVGQRERGLRDLRKALESDPVNAYALESMAGAEYANRRYFEARAFSERRLAAAPVTASVLQLAIQIEQGLGDIAAASRYQQRLVKDFPDAATAHPGANAL